MTDPLDEVDLEAEREHVEHAAATAIAQHVASDRVKGVGPFDARGIAGTPGESSP